MAKLEGPGFVSDVQHTTVTGQGLEVRFGDSDTDEAWFLLSLLWSELEAFDAMRRLKLRLLPAPHREDEYEMFNAAWDTCAERGECDERGSAEYERCVDEWDARGCLFAALLFIKTHANQVPPPAENNAAGEHQTT